jgi:hypothetical protein
VRLAPLRFLFGFPAKSCPCHSTCNRLALARLPALGGRAKRSYVAKLVNMGKLEKLEKLG